MPVFPIASDADDGRVYYYGATYPPAAGPNHDSAFGIGRNWISGGSLYYVHCGLLRWNTASLLDSDYIPSAKLRLFNPLSGWADSDAREMTMDWYAWDGVSASDYSLVAQTSAFAGRRLNVMSYNAWNEFPLLLPDQNISRTGYTYLRLHISGGQPTGQNDISWHSSLDANPPELVVETIGREGLAPNAIAAQSGFDPLLVLADTQLDPDA